MTPYGDSEREIGGPIEVGPIPEGFRVREEAFPSQYMDFFLIPFYFFCILIVFFKGGS